MIGRERGVTGSLDRETESERERESCNVILSVWKNVSEADRTKGQRKSVLQKEGKDGRSDTKKGQRQLCNAGEQSYLRRFIVEECGS